MKTLTKERHAAMVLIKQYRPAVDYSSYVSRDIWRNAAVRAVRQEIGYAKWAEAKAK
jgi:hypothetical protein